MATDPHMRAGLARNRSPALLRGLIFGADGRALSPTVGAVVKLTHVPFEI
jgi:hypothetical protein